MGLRTEDLFIAHADDQNEEGLTFAVEGTVNIVEPLGNETNLHMDLQGVRMVAKTEGRRHFAVGDKLPMKLDLAHLHIFDAQSEQSIY